MIKPDAIQYKIDFDSTTKLYTGYCPGMSPVEFTDADESRVKELVEDGIDLYLKKNPDFFNNYHYKGI